MTSVHNISRLRPFGPKLQYVNVIIETPKGSRTKFKYDQQHNMFVFDKVLPIGQSFPFDFGFVPSTKGADGDPLDVMLIADEPTFVGCLVHAKLLGVIEAEQTENGKTERNDRLVAVPVEAKTGRPSRGAVEHLESSLATRITEFFVTYNELQGKLFKTLGCAGPTRAMALIRAGMGNRTSKRAA
jgi:inorganic pyrophosphatase